MSKIVWKGSTLLSPVPPALVSCGTLEKPNALTIAWTGIVNSQPPKTYISVRPERYSHELIQSSGEFVINLTTQAMVRSVDLCGVRSGRDVDKFALCGFTAEPASAVSCPIVAQSPISLECRVIQMIPMESHDMFLAEIVAVDIDETLVDPEGKLHLERAGLVAYAHGSYYALGRELGSFGYSVRKKPRKRG